MFRKALFISLSLLASTSMASQDLEPCINGAVSASGSFPTQAMEDQIHAYLNWKPGSPYYLFEVASSQIEDGFPQN